MREPTGNGLISDSFSFFLVDVGRAAFSSSVIVLRLEEPEDDDDDDDDDEDELGRSLDEEEEDFEEEEDEEDLSDDGKDEDGFDEEAEDGLDEDEDLGAAATDVGCDIFESSDGSTSVYSSIMKSRNPSKVKNPIV
ncbi:hypothetical protein QFC19_004200 [Naganishia cerealis]|uniref:Uncharacterized protein n=1 Tax=Naganishia cerealis TaxID=610337 RepID=A0ACC2VX09_9TREE|nr:hypothetical protein QFC19_004200 [Naganishia cerealis]